MQCEYDPEKMIDEIRKRPGIWDYDDPSYRLKEARHKLWQEVVQELVAGSGISCSKSELRELELQLQKKWKGIRDCFQKHLTKPNYSKRPYIYTKQLQFLKKSLKARSSSKGLLSRDDDDSDSDEPPKARWRNKTQLKAIKNEDSSDDDNDGDNFQELPVYYEYNEADDNGPTQAAKVAKISTNKPLEEFAFANVDSSDDGDRMFLLSLLPHLKAIPEEFRMDAKIELMQIIRNAKRKSNGSMI